MNNYYSIDELKFFYFSVVFDESGYRNETNTTSTDDILCYLYFFYPISLINLNDLNTPYKVTMGYYYYPINLKFHESNIISYELTEIHTDNYFIGNNDNVKLNYFT